MIIFDRDILKIRRKKALDRTFLHAADFDFLHREVADRLSERLEEVERNFKSPLQMGMLGGLLPSLMSHRHMTKADRTPYPDRQIIELDEENLPHEQGKYDLIVSNLLMHWVNDLPGALIQMQRALKPDGLFIASLFGGESLKELRHSLMIAESEISGGVSPRISPFVDIRDAGSLLQRAGFALPVTDMDTLTVEYESPLKVMQDLRGMGESNAVLDRRKGLTPPSLMMRAAEIYQQQFGLPNGKVPATFQIVYLTGWHPHESQQKPLRPGSAQNRLAEALKTTEDKF